MSQRILLVEDDAHVVKLLRELLALEGYEVTVAGDGLAGLAKLETDPPAALLLDVMMPDIDGVRLLEQVLEDHGGQVPVPILVVTGSPDGARRCRQLLGDHDVFLKPFDPAELIARLQLRLAGGAPR